MKRSFTLLLPAASLLLHAPARAIESPADDAPPPPPIEAPAEAANPPQEAEAKAPQAAGPGFLGIVTDQIPDVLAAHLPVEPGTGVIIRDIAPDSPAARAGLEENDVVVSVNEQVIGNPQDLSRLIQEHEAGSKVALERIHRGAKETVEVTLGERPAEAQDAFPQRPNPRPGQGNAQLNELLFEGVPQEHADRLREMIQRNLQAMELRLGDARDAADGAAAAMPDLERVMREAEARLRERMQALEGNAAAPGDGAAAGRVKIGAQATVTIMDKEGSVEVRTVDGGKEATVRDLDGTILWNGPWDTEQDRAAAPENIRKRLEGLKLDHKFQGDGLRLQLQGGAAEEP